LYEQFEKVNKIPSLPEICRLYGGCELALMQREAMAKAIMGTRNSLPSQLVISIKYSFRY
jgi:hypothetical protein